VSPLHDREAIERILRSPGVYEKLIHDGREPGYIDHHAASYWGAWHDEALVGVFLAVRFSQWEVEAHAALEPAAIRFGRDFARLFMARMFDDPRLERITAYVMGTLPSAVNFCKKLGLKEEGRRRNACMIGGTPCDVLIYGIIRSEFFTSRRHV
jgi:RimJ/RimL family protein N-acetyltransferase